MLYLEVKILSGIPKLRLEGCPVWWSVELRQFASGKKRIWFVIHLDPLVNSQESTLKIAQKWTIQPVRSLIKVLQTFHFLSIGPSSLIDSSWPSTFSRSDRSVNPLMYFDRPLCPRLFHVERLICQRFHFWWHHCHPYCVTHIVFLWPLSIF